MVRVQKQWGIDSLDSDGRDWMGISLINLSVLSRNRGNYEEADALASEALALYTELMKEAPRDSSRHSALMYGQTRALTQHAGGLVFKQQYEAAEKIYREALTEQAMLSKRFPQLAEVREDLAQTHEMLADLLKATQRPGEAEAALREAIQVRQQLCKDFPGRPAPSIALAHNQYKLGAVLASRDRPTEAEEAYRSAMALYEQLAAKWPKNDTYLAGLTAAQERLQELRKQTSRP
jgi:tetratricopeptide (TPR) repeat protein